MDATQDQSIAAIVSRKARRPKMPIIIPPRVAERAATRCYVDANGCHISTYSTASHGYAQIGWSCPEGRWLVTAHRAAWVHATGEQIPKGMTIDHLCRERRCVNPDHLRMLSNFENARRTRGRDWPLGQCANGHSNESLVLVGEKLACGICIGSRRTTQSAPTKEPARRRRPKATQPKPPRLPAPPKPVRTHCNRGHELTPENTYVPPSRNERVCRECQNIREAGRIGRRRVGSGEGWRWETASEARSRAGLAA